MINQQQADEIIRAAKNRGLTKEQTVIILKKAASETPSPVAQPMPEQSTTQKVADFLGLKTAKNNIDTVWNLGGQGARNQKAEMDSSKAFQQSQALIAEAKKTSDPKKKKALLDQSRAIMETSGQQMDAFRTDLDRRQFDSGITEKDLTRSNADFALRRGAGQSGELASWLLPAKAALPVATAGGRIAQGAMRGAIAGAGQGVSKASEADTITQGAGDIASSTAVGAGLGAGFSGVGEVFGKAGRIISGRQQRFVTNQAQKETLGRWGVKDVDPILDIVDEALPDDQYNKTANKYVQYAIDKLRSLEPGKPSSKKVPMNDVVKLNKTARSLFKGDKTKIDGNKLRSEVVKSLHTKGETPQERDFIDSIIENVSLDKSYSINKLFDLKAWISKKKLGYSPSGEPKAGDKAAYYQALDREIKKTLTKLSGKNSRTFNELYDKMGISYFLDDVVNNRVGRVQDPLTKEGQRLGHPVSTFLGLVGRPVGAIVESGKPQAAMRSISNMIPKSQISTGAKMSPNIVIPPAVAAMQRKLEEDAAYKKRMSSRAVQTTPAY